MKGLLLSAILIIGASADVPVDLQQPSNPGQLVKGTHETLGEEMNAMLDGSLHRRLRSGYSRTRSHGGGDDNPIVDMIIGLVMWCCCLPCVIFLNEKIAIKQAKLQGKALTNCIEVEDVNRPPLQQLNGHVVYISGTSQCQQTLTDSLFTSVRSTNCIKLRRKVEMYQWVQHSDDDSTTFKMEWKDSYQKCDKGGPERQNPPMPITSTQRSTENYRVHVRSGAGDACAEAAHDSVRLGAYYLGEYIIREMVNWKDLPVNLPAGRIPSQLARFGPPRQEAEYWYFGSGSAIGDIRVSFETLDCGPITLCGILTRVGNGWTLVPIIREETDQGESCAREFGCSCGRPDIPAFSGNPAQDEELLEWLEEHDAELTSVEKEGLLHGKSAHANAAYSPTADGPITSFMHKFGLEEEFLAVSERHVDFEDLMEAEARWSSIKHCGCRVCSMICGMIGASLIISPLTYLLNYNWLTKVMGGFVLSLVLGCAACLISLIVSLIIIGMAWFAARPRLTATLFIIAALITVPVVSFFMTAHFHEGRQEYISADQR